MPSGRAEDERATPEIAVVVPTYRRLNRALRMIDALERQTLAPDRFEVVVVDDCSGDGTVEALKARSATTPLRIRVVCTPVNGGPAAARNTGWRSTSAPFVAFTDDDCVPAPGWLKAGMTVLCDDPEVGVVQGRTLCPPDAEFGEWALWRKITYPSPYFEGCNLFFRRDALEAAGGFDEGLARAAEDTAAGWSVLAAGWFRDFAKDAVVFHDVESRTVWWHARHGFRERANVMAVAARHPTFRREAFWRPWAFRPEDVACTVAIAGLLLGVRWRPALLLAVPYLAPRRPRPGQAHPVRILAGQFAIDAARAAGGAIGAARNRMFVI